MENHRPKLEVQGVGTWVLGPTKEEAEFTGRDSYVPAVRGNLWKFFEGGSKPRFVDPQHRFVLLDAQDEVLRGDANLGELKTVATLKRAENRGLRRSRFLSEPGPVFIFEHGLLVFDENGQLRWSLNNLKLDQFFQQIRDGKIVYSSEHCGKWAYDLATGQRTTLD